MINLEIPRRLDGFIMQAQQVAKHVFRPISRKYDLAEHTYPKELDMLATVLDAMNQSGAGAGVSTIKGVKRDEAGVRNGANMMAALGTMELCWGDVAMLLTIPRQGLGNAAMAAVATEEQLLRFKGQWSAMAITEPEAGSDSGAIRTTAVLDGDEWVINGEKIFVTCGERADSVVVWATLDPKLGKSAIKSFVVEKGTPGMDMIRLDHKLGIRASDTATIMFTDCRIPKGNLLGSSDINAKRGFSGAMQTFDNTRPLVAAMAVGLARASLDLAKELLSRHVDLKLDYCNGPHGGSAISAEIYRMESDLEAARLLTLKAAWMADNGIPNSMVASMAKAKAARVGNAISLRCVELCGASGYGENELLEKWARDSKILDIFEGTQQIQLLIIARRLLDKNSSQLR